MGDFDEKSSSKEIFTRLRRTVSVLTGSVILIVILIIAVSYINSSGQKENTDLINALGKQRMLTQLMAKEASRISVLQSAIVSPNRLQPKEALNKKIVEAKSNLEIGISEFDATYNDIVIRKLKESHGFRFFRHFTGAEDQRNIYKLGSLWSVYKINLNIVMKKENTDPDFSRALIYVNANDSELLRLSDVLVQDVLNSTSREYGTGRGIALALLILLAVFTIYTLRKFYVYLFLPLEELYNGFSGLGIGLVEDTGSEKDGIKDVIEEIRGVFRSIKEMFDLVGNLNKNVSFNDTLNYIFETFSKYVPYTYIGIAMFTSDGTKKLKASYGVSGEHHKGMAAELVGLTVELESTSLWKLVESGKPRVINNLNEYFKNRVINSYSKILLEHGIKSSITLPLLVSSEHIGFIFFSSNKPNVYKASHVDFLESVSSAIAISMEKNIFIDELVYSSVLALAKLAEAKDEETGDHIDRMRKYACKLANLLKAEERFENIIDPEFLMDMEKFSPMHDIGKVGIPDNILLKPGKLTEEEFNVMKTHPTFGAEVLRKAEENINHMGRSMFAMGIDIAKSHHEKWDGSGYPEHLRGDDIPLSARIVALADVLDALLSNRPYKRAFTFEESTAIILEGRDKHFDPLVVDMFEAHLEEFRDIYKNSKYE